MSLSDAKIRNSKPREKAYKLSDEKGLYLHIAPNNSKYWRFKYRFDGKEKLLAFGVYPDVSLADARVKRDEARKQVANQTDPGFLKQMKKQTSKIEQEGSFEVIAREWHAKHSTGWTLRHSNKIMVRLERDIFPWLGKRPINEITAPELLSCLRRVEKRGTIELTHRLHQYCSRVFRYAIATGHAERDISYDLRGAISPVITRHHPSITDVKSIAGLLSAIEGYQGAFVTRCALQFVPLVFVRSGELRHAEWSEINFETAEWRIPAAKMKMRSVHIIPLSTQAIAILKEIQPLTGSGKYVFPSVRTLTRPMSENTVNAALRRLGYTKEEMTGHGFRSMASTLLNEQGWNRDAIERQLAHAERDAVRAAYNYAEHLPERRKMMQHWADFLEGLVNKKSQIITHPICKIS